MYFWKRLIVYQKLGLSSKRSKFLGVPNQQSSLFFSEILHMYYAYKKVFKKVYFFWIGRSLKTKQKENIKIHSQVFKHCYVQHMCKISRKNMKSYFSWSSWKSSFFKQKTLLFCKDQVFVKNHLSVFFSAEPV